MQQLKENAYPEFRSKVIHTLFSEDLESELDRICREAEQAIADGVSLLILSDKDMSKEKAAIPSLLAASALHQELIRHGNRTKVSIIIESGKQGKSIIMHP